MHLDFLRRQTGHFRGGRLSEGRHLCPYPDIAAVRANVDRAVRRLHSGVSEERHLVNCLDLLSGARHGLAGIALLVRDNARQRMSSAARPFLAAHVWSATAATASSRRTTLCMPLIVFALLSSTLASLPPNTGQAATKANFIPGTLTSMPNFAVPLTLSGASRRLADVPISLKSFGSLSGMLRGSGSAAALSASAP